jgi:hypothetical protein
MRPRNEHDLDTRGPPNSDPQIKYAHGEWGLSSLLPAVAPRADCGEIYSCSQAAVLHADCRQGTDTIPLPVTDIPSRRDFCRARGGTETERVCLFNSR